MWTTKKTTLSGERLSWRRGKDPSRRSALSGHDGAYRPTT